MLQSRQLALPSYLVAFSLVVLPPLDQLIQIFPLRVGDARWRFGAFGLLSNSLLLSTVGVLVALVVASVFEHRRFRRILGVGTLTVVLVLAAAWVVFALDVLQVRNGVNAQAARAFFAASVSAALRSFFAVLSLTVLGVTAFRGSKPIAKPAKRSAMVVSGPESRTAKRSEAAVLDVSDRTT